MFKPTKYNILSVKPDVRFIAEYNTFDILAWTVNNSPTFDNKMLYLCLLIIKRCIILGNMRFSVGNDRLWIIGNNDRKKNVWIS